VKHNQTTTTSGDITRPLLHLVSDGLLNRISLLLVTFSLAFLICIPSHIPSSIFSYPLFDHTIELDMELVLNNMSLRFLVYFLPSYPRLPARPTPPRVVYSICIYIYGSKHNFAAFNLDKLWVPSSSDFGGITDRHLIVSSGNVLSAISIIDPLGECTLNGHTTIQRTHCHWSRLWTYGALAAHHLCLFPFSSI
jgi:hypothetical protein